MKVRIPSASERGQRLRLVAALTLLGSMLAILLATPLGSLLWQLLLDPSSERLAQFLDTTAMWLPVVLVILMILHTLIPVPAELLAVAAGMALGPVWGIVTIWIGAMAGACLGFFLARALGQPLLTSHRTSGRLGRWLWQLQHTDVPVLLAVRLLPVVSFNLVNFALGLSPLGWWRFLWTTGVGILPVTVLVVAFGAYLEDWRVLLLMTVLAILFGFAGYCVLRSRRVTTPSQHPIRRCTSPPQEALYRKRNTYGCPYH